jgi:D-lyxose ketol-isomerase
MKSAEVAKVRKRALSMLKKARIAIRQDEAEKMEVTDFGLNDLKRMGLQLITYENNDRYCAKELVMFPGQTCPEHKHPPRANGSPGKQETFRCRFGKVYLYVEGPAVRKPKASIPKRYRKHFTVKNEIILEPGDQFTLPPDTFHWFQAGKKGAVLSEFSSNSEDETDVWTDPSISRTPVYE